MSCAGAVLQPHPVLRRADRRRVEPTALRMRRLSPPAGCGGCSVRGKPGRCLQDSISTNRGTRVRHHPRPRPTARSRFSSRSGSGASGRRRRARGARLALHGPAWREGARAWTPQKSQGLTFGVVRSHSLCANATRRGDEGIIKLRLLRIPASPRWSIAQGAFGRARRRRGRATLKRF